MLVTAIATGLGVSTAVASGIVAVGSVAASVGLTLVSNALMPDADTGRANTREEMEIGGRVPRSVLLGAEIPVAGQLIRWDTNQGDRRYLNYVIVLADYPISALRSLYVYDKQCTLGAGNNSSNGGKGRAVTQYNKKGKDYLWLRFYDGTQTSADPWLVANLQSWNSSDILSGCPYVCITALANPKAFDGQPTFRFIVDGAPLYDPRRDATADGGAGTQRYGTFATHEFSGNPAVIAYNLLRGLRWADDYVYGFQDVDAGDIPLLEFRAAADRCDESVPRKGGAGNEPRYRAGAQISVDTEVGRAIELFNGAMAGRLVDTGGYLKLYAGGPSAPVIDLTDDDIIDDEAAEAQRGAAFEDAVNGVSGTFIDPDQDYLEASLPSRFSAADEARDSDQRLVADLDLTAVRSQTQGQRIMEATRQAAGYDFRQRTKFHCRALAVEPGDVIRLSSERLGYSNRLFEVRRASVDAILCPTLDLSQVDPAIWDWTPATDELDRDGERLLPAGPLPFTVAGFGASWSREAGAGGNELRIDLVWTSPDDATIDRLHYKWRRTGQTRVRRGVTADVESGQVSIIGGLQTLASYDVAVAYEANREVGDYTDWLTVTLPRRRLDAEDFQRAVNDNRVYNPSLELLDDDGSPLGWTVAGTGWAGSVRSARDGSNGFLEPIDGEPCRPGQSWRAVLTATKSGASTVLAQLAYLNNAGVVLGAPVNAELFGAGEQQAIAAGPAPNGARSVRLRAIVNAQTTGSVAVTFAALRRMQQDEDLDDDPIGRANTNGRSTKLLAAKLGDLATATANGDTINAIRVTAANARPSSVKIVDADLDDDPLGRANNKSTKLATARLNDLGAALINGDTAASIRAKANAARQSNVKIDTDDVALQSITETYYDTLNTFTVDSDYAPVSIDLAGNYSDYKIFFECFASVRASAKNSGVNTRQIVSTIPENAPANAGYYVAIRYVCSLYRNGVNLTGDNTLGAFYENTCLAMAAYDQNPGSNPVYRILPRQPDFLDDYTIYMSNLVLKVTVHKR